MDLLITILTCSLYASDDSVVRAIAEGVSAGNPTLVVNPVADGAQADAAPMPTTARDATARASELMAAGATPLLGLMQLPPAWLDAFGRPLASAFDPCINIAIGTAMLSEFDARCAWPVPAHDERARMLERTNRRACVLRRYEAAIGSADFADAVMLELSAQRPASAPIAEAPIFAPASARAWGPDKLLIPMPTAPAPQTIAPATLP
jgi:Transglycosylase SLT domain